MPWLSTFGFEPALPNHCVPQNDFLLRFSSTFHTCVPTPLAFASNLLGTLSIISWLFAQLPQIYKNWSLQSTSGLSFGFLVVWCLGDICNLLGALFTHQASWQVTIGAYYVFVDLCLVGQWIWYERLRHGRPVFRVWNRQHRDDNAGGARGAMEQVVIEGMAVLTPSTSRGSGEQQADDSGKGTNDSAKKQAETRPRIIFRTPTFQREPEKSSYSRTSTSNTIHRIGASSSPMPSPSPRTMLLIACLIAIVQASPLKTTTATSALATKPTPLENAGTILSWCSTLLYLGSRLPQIRKNYREKSVAGLSPQLFIAAFMGNLFYSSALATNPSAWNDLGSYGSGGWAGPDGSDRTQWVAAAMPFFLGAFGVLGLDGSVGVQFLMYGERIEEELVIVEEGGDSKWRRVSGWMRGWVPGSFGGVKAVNTQALLGDDVERNRHYGAA